MVALPFQHVFMKLKFDYNTSMLTFLMLMTVVLSGSFALKYVDQFLPDQLLGNLLYAIIVFAPITFEALSLAAFMATMRADCSLAMFSATAW